VLPNAGKRRSATGIADNCRHFLAMSGPHAPRARTPRGHLRASSGVLGHLPANQPLSLTLLGEDTGIRRRRRFDRKRLRYKPRVLAARRVVEVTHRRLDVRVTHPLLHTADIGLGDHASPERVAQIVEAERAETGVSESRFEATAERRAVEVAAGHADEDQVVVPHPVLPATELRQR
jgi:hypothetical protein